MEVTFLNLRRIYIYIESEIDSAIQKVLESTAFILGLSVSDNKNEIVKMNYLKFCLGTSSNTYCNHPSH